VIRTTRRRARRSVPAGLVIAVGALAGIVPAAHASTLSNSGTTLVFTAAAGIANDTYFSETAPGTVEVSTYGDPATSVPANCTDISAGATAKEFSCTGVTAVSASTLDKGDYIGAYGLTMIPAMLDGGADDDYVVGGNGSDTLNGGGGDDYLEGEKGADDIHGDGGFDSVYYSSSGPTPAGVPVSVTLDDAANDGRQGEESDNVHSDVEDVSVNGTGAAVITGTAGTNSLSGGDGNDTIDGGAANDFLYGYGGDDNIQARDGFADRVSCGAGNDTATVDTLDVVSDTCETVLRADVGNANDVPEDKSPTIAWVTPAENAKMSTKAANVLQVGAADDKGVAQVIFLAGTRTLCVDTTAPFTCAYNPRDADLGKVTLTAMAVDAAQQSATALRSVVVGRFSPKSVTATTKPGRDATSPYSFTTGGRLSMPAGVGRSLGCQGKVNVQIKTGTKTVSSRSVNLSKSCTYSSKVRFTLPSRLHPKSLRVFVTFRGNEVLAAMKARTRSVKVA
jgi:Ca2+-binding RTX toxin-like protein